MTLRSLIGSPQSSTARWVRTLFLAILSGLLVSTTGAPIALAQDDWDDSGFEDDGADDGSTDDDGWDDGSADDGWDDTDIDTSDFDTGDGDVPVIDTSVTLPFATGLIVTNDILDPRVAEELSFQLVDELGTIPTVEAVPNDELRDEFEVMGTELANECAFDPVCLGRVGWDIGLDRVVIGRAAPSRDSDRLSFTLDLVDLETRSVLRYRSVEVEDSVPALSQAITTQLPLLFEIRDTGDDNVVGPRGQSTGQRIAAWSALGLGVGALALGVVFGLDASSTEDEVVSGPLRNPNVYEMTQVEARAMLDDAEDKALLSNVFLGTGVALVGVAVLLFLITPGSDIDDNAELEASVDLPSFGPTADGWGVSTSVRF